MKSKVLVIVGPTASGKSALGVSLAQKFGGEIISADSRQVYKGLNIGTGKITKKEMRGIPHHLLDVTDAKKKFSAGDYVRLARKAYASVLQKTAIAIVVGGTGFYIDSFLGRIEVPDVEPNAKLRALLRKKTVTQLFALLKKRDPKRAKMMDTPSERNNKVRLIRALEIAHSTDPVQKKDIGSPFDALWIGINPKFATLEKNISTRLASRMKSGMIAEAKRLHKAGLSYKRMEELGLEYRSLAHYLQGAITKAEMQAALQRDIRRYAKKQLAYWKRNGEIKWFDPKSKQIERTVRAWLTS